MNGKIARLRVYPIKSIDGAEVAASRILASGALQHDREFAIVELDGAFVTGKREPRTHLLRARWNLAEREGLLTSMPLGRSQRFELDGATAEVEAFLGEHFGRPVRLVRDTSTGFPDDSSAPGPTIISTATLEEVASWFSGLSVESVRRRLRANVEVDGVEAFWEDALFGEEGTLERFMLGSARLDGVNPCARCIVPSRDPDDGAPIQAFSKIVSQRRAASLPVWAERSRFNHFYRLSVNTRADRAAGNVVAVGDRVTYVPFGAPM